MVVDSISFAYFGELALGNDDFLQEFECELTIQDCVLTRNALLRNELWFNRTMRYKFRKSIDENFVCELFCFSL